nr:chemotaxis protein CheR [candidate division Zixibacteria bacterium]
MKQVIGLSPVLKADTFYRLREIVYQQSGISLNDSKESLVKARVAKRMRALRMESYDDYLDLILNDPTGVEIQMLLDAISTNTTSFYREADHFDFLRTVIKDWLNKGQRIIRIWCTASSTGEEPYTLAIELAENIGRHSVEVRILATDINLQVLRAAQSGVYTEDRIAPIPKHLKTKYFNKIKHNHEIVYQVRDDLKKMIIYRQLNLSTPPFPIRPEVDIIMCRNVMIYFDTGLRRKLAVEFERLLRTGGHLFTGHAESMTGMAKRLKCLKPSIYIKE